MRYNEQVNKKVHSQLPIEDVKRFLQTTSFDNYQSIELPHGLKTPGMDRSRSAEIIFRNPVKGKSLLDIGCKYGYFCHEAFGRGAEHITGIEIDENNARIATRIAELWGRDISIQCADFMTLDIRETYDVVLFLNVLHHILSPVEALRIIGSVARELAVIEFSTILDDHSRLSVFQKLLIKTFFPTLPLAFIGTERYHKIWYFSRQALHNLLVKQLDLFRKVEFIVSPRKTGRLIAFCWK